MYVSKGVINVLYNWELFSSIMSWGMISVVDWTITIQGTWISWAFVNLNNNVSITDVWIIWVKKAVQNWNILHTLTNGGFQIDYVKTDSYSISTMENIVNVNLWWLFIDDFYIVDDNIILYSRTNGYYYLNWDYILYSFYDNDNGINLEKTINSVFQFATRPLYSKWNLTKSSDIWSILNVPFNNWWVSGTEKYIKDNIVKLALDPSKVIPNTFSKNIKVRKFTSLTFWPPTDIVTQLITWNIPLIWYWILLVPPNSATQLCDRTNAVPLNAPVTTTTKVFNIKDGNYCLYVSPYDEWFNTFVTTEKVQMIWWVDILVKTDAVIFWDPEIQRNVIWDTTKDIDFYIYSSKELKTMTVNYSDRFWGLITDSLTATWSNKIQYVSSTNNSYKYVFHTNVSDLNQTTIFNISWEDYYWNLWNLVYQYDLYKWYYQVLWLTQTDVWVKSDAVDKTQSKKWFLYWLASPDSWNKDNIQTLFFFDKPNKWLNEVPTKLVWANIKVDLDLLKFNLKDFRWRSMKPFNYDPNKRDYVFENWYYYYYDGDLTLSWTLWYYWNWVLVVWWKLKIKWDITKNVSNATKQYENTLKIYAIDNIDVYNGVNRIDSDVFTNKTISTYATTNSNAIASWLWTFIDTNGLFIIWVSKYGEQL
jgi:hypothetical protein